jgi:hypothetical protein
MEIILEARVACRETAGFRTTCSGTGVLAVIFMSLSRRAGLDDTMSAYSPKHKTRQI